MIITHKGSGALFGFWVFLHQGFGFGDTVQAYSRAGMWCLETCLGLETVSRPDSEVLVLVSVLKKKVLVLVSVLRKKVLVLVSVLRPKVLMSWSRDQDQDIKLRLCFNVLKKCETSVACIKKLMFHEQRRKCTPENTILTARPVFVLKLNTVVWDHCLHEFHRYGR